MVIDQSGPIGYYIIRNSAYVLNKKKGNYLLTSVLNYFHSTGQENSTTYTC